MKEKAIIIGAGLGGMATALTLSERFEVHIFDKNNTVGGKMQSIDFDGFHFDFGPNTLTMPHYFWQVLEPYTNARERLPFRKLPNPTQHRLHDLTLDFTTDIERMVQQLASIDEESAKNYPLFIKEVTRLFHLSEAAFLEKTFFKLGDYIKPQLAKDLLQAQPFKTLDAFLANYFPHPFIRQLFGRFATYIGSSPFATPATFAMIAYFELVEGTYFLEGGASQIAKVFQEALIEQNAVFHLNEPIEKIATDGEKIIFCETTVGRYEAELVVSNVDYDYFQRLLGRPSTKDERSSSAYVELIGLHRPVSLAHHNLLFSRDYAAEFAALRKGHYASEPTIYSCYPYASDTSHQPALFILINAPNATATTEQQQKHVNKALEKWGIPANNIATRKVLPPTFLKETFNLVDGAIYGRASNNIKGSFFRPANKDPQLKNLYYVGGTVHPGGGSPIVVKGGYHLAKRIIAEYKNKHE